MHHKTIVNIFNNSIFFLIKIIQAIKKILNFFSFVVKSLFIILLLIETTVKNRMTLTSKNNKKTFSRMRFHPISLTTQT